MGNAGVKPKELFISGNPLPEWSKCIAALVTDPSIATMRDGQGRTALARAVIERAPDTIFHLIKKNNPDAISARDDDGFTPLHHVLMHNGIEANDPLFRIVYESYPDACKISSKLGVLPLHVALRHRADVDIITELLDNYPESASILYKASFPLHIAIESKCSLPILKELVRHFPDGPRRKGVAGQFALHMLAKNKPHIEAVRFIAELNMDAVMDKSTEGRLPLHYALERQASNEVVLYLARLNLNSTAVTAFGGNMPLHIALDMHYSFEVVSVLVEECPRAVHTLDSQDILPLRKAIKERMSNDIVLLLIKTHPDACQEQDEYERYSIHYAASRNYSNEVVAELISVFPSAIRLCDKSGQLPLHIAMVHEDNVDVIRSLIQYYPEGTLVADEKNYLPLHYAIENLYGTEIIDMLIKAGQPATEFQCKGRLPLLMAIEFKHCFDTLALLLAAYPRAIFQPCESTDSKLKGILPLHLAIERQLSEEIQLFLMDNYFDDGSGGPAISTDQHGLFPIHYAVKYHSTLPVVTKLLDMFPSIVEMAYGPTNNKLLVHYACEECAPPFAVAEILIRTMPFDYNFGKPNANHLYTWTYVVAETGDRYFEAVDIILRNYKYEYVRLLADCPDVEGRKAVDVATSRCKTEILSRLFYFERYELQQEMYVHKSEGCLVRFALDHKASESTATTVGLPGKTTPQKVALKFMRYSHEFNRELSVRSEVQFDDKHVVQYLRCHDGDADSEYKLETIRKGYEEYPYCIVLVAAQLSLDDIIKHERLACKDWYRIREYSRQIVFAVQHLHNKGYIHSDLKPLNILRMPGELTAHNQYFHHFSVRLCDMGGVMSHISGFTAGIKCSPAYIPPEMVYVVPFTQRNKFDGATACVRYAPNALCLQNQQAEIDALPSDSAERQTYVKKYFFSTNYSLVPAHTALDIWSLGVIFYELFSGMHLFIKSDEDNIDEKSLNMLAEWSEGLKAEKLAKIPDLYARNLVYQMLSKDPARRPSAEKILQHPFMTQIPCPRVPQEPHLYDVYISCRKSVKADSAYADKIAKIFEEQGLSVYLCKHSMIKEKDAAEEHCNKLAQSRIFVPVFSNESVRNRKITEYNWEKLSSNSALDYLLFDLRLAMELYYMKMIEFVFPVLVGHKDEQETAKHARRHDHHDHKHEHDHHQQQQRQLELHEADNRRLSDGSGMSRSTNQHSQEGERAPQGVQEEASVGYHTEYFAAYRGDVIGKFGGSHPNAPEVVVLSIEEQLRQQLDRLKLGVPRYHQGYPAVYVIRSVVTDFDDYVIVGNSDQCIPRIVGEMMQVVYPQEEEPEGMGGAGSGTASPMRSPLGKTRSVTGSPITAAGVGAPGSPSKRPGTSASMGAATGVVMPAIPDINLMSDAERITYVNKINTELHSKMAAIAILEGELVIAESLAVQKTEELKRLRRECNVQMPFIDFRAPQKEWE